MKAAEKEKAAEHAIPEKPKPSIIGRSDLRHLFDVAGDVRSAKDGRRRFIVPGVIPAAPCFLYGPSGCGKSGVAINLALAVGSGRPWGGITIERGSVIYVPAEDRFGIEERLLAAAEAAGLDPKETNVAVALFDEMKMEGIVDGARQMAERINLPVSLVIIDTMGAAFGGKSQDDAGPATEMMDQFDRISRQLKCAVVAIHHTGKSQGAGMRGSQVFFDRARAVIRADRGSLKVEKLSSAPSGAAFSFEIASHDLVTSAGTASVQIVRDVQPLTEEDIQAKAEKQKRFEQTDADVALARLLELARTGPVSLKEWQDRCYSSWAAKPSDKLRRAALSKAKVRFEEARQITVDGDRVTVTVTNVTGDNPVTQPPEQRVSPSPSPTPLFRGGDGDVSRDRETEGEGNG